MPYTVPVRHITQILSISLSHTSFLFCLFVSFCCFLLNFLILIHGEKVCALLFLYRELFFLLARTHTGNDNCTLFRHFNKNYYAYHLSRDGNAYESVRSTCLHFNKTHERWIRTVSNCCCFPDAITFARLILFSLHAANKVRVVVYHNYACKIFRLNTRQHKKETYIHKNRRKKAHEGNICTVCGSVLCAVVLCWLAFVCVGFSFSCTVINGPEDVASR